MVFLQNSQLKFKKCALRGVHFQTQHSQGKLVKVIKGEVFDVAVNIRNTSKTYNELE